jgi:hypothetical protein
MLISADFVKCNSTGSAGNNDKKLKLYFFDYITGTDQVFSDKEDNQASKILGTDKLTSNTFIAHHMRGYGDYGLKVMVGDYHIFINNYGEISSKNIVDFMTSLYIIFPL